MILDAIENSALIETLNPRFKKAFDYLKNNDLASAPQGVIEIDGKNIYISISEFDGKPDGEARLEIMTRPGLAAVDAAQTCYGYAHVSFSVGSREAVDALTSRLRNDGYEVTDGPRTTGDGYYESCVRGPEGCLVEITA